MLLEDCPKIGISKSFLEGLKALFSNIVPFLKFQVPALVVSVLCILPMLIFYILWQNIQATVFVGLLFLILFYFVFWYYLLGYVGVSYLAKDIYENKPVLGTMTYFRYVKAHTASYIKFFLWQFLIQLLLGFALNYFYDRSLPLFVFFTVMIFPLTAVLSFAHIFWAYQDKTHPLDSIVSAIKTSYKSLDFMKFFGLALLFTLAYLMVCALFSILIYLIFLAVDLGLAAKGLIFFISASFFTILVLPSIIFMIMSMLTYALSFIFTRVYFDIVRK